MIEPGNGRMRLGLWSESYPSGYFMSFKNLKVHLQHRIIEWLKALGFNLHAVVVESKPSM